MLDDLGGCLRGNDASWCLQDVPLGKVLDNQAAGLGEP